MKKIKLLICFFLSYQIGYAQIEKNIAIDFGIAFRGAAIVLADKPFVRNSYGFSYDETKLFRNKSVVIDIKKNVFNKKCYLQLSNYFRYGHFHYQKDPTTNVSTELKRFKRDHFLDFLYEFGKQKANHFIFTLGAGYGFMNFNTSFTYNRYQGTDASGNPILVPTTGSFRFNAPRLIVGLRRNKLQCFIIVHGTPDEQFEPNPTLCIETKFTYSFFKFDVSKINEKIKQIFNL